MFAEVQPWVPSRKAMAIGLVAVGVLTGVAAAGRLARRRDGRS